MRGDRPCDGEHDDSGMMFRTHDRNVWIFILHPLTEWQPSILRYSTQNPSPIRWLSLYSRESTPPQHFLLLVCAYRFGPVVENQIGSAEKRCEQSKIEENSLLKCVHPEVRPPSAPFVYESSFPSSKSRFPIPHSQTNAKWTWRQWYSEEGSLWLIQGLIGKSIALWDRKSGRFRKLLPESSWQDVDGDEDWKGEGVSVVGVL